MWASEEAVRSRPLGLSGSAFDCRMDHAGDPTAIDEQAEAAAREEVFIHESEGIGAEGFVEER